MQSCCWGNGKLIFKKEKIKKLDNFILSATAPETMVAAVAANIAWKIKSVK